MIYEYIHDGETLKKTHHFFDNLKVTEKGMYIVIDEITYNVRKIIEGEVREKFRTVTGFGAGNSPYMKFELEKVRGV